MKKLLMFVVVLLIIVVGGLAYLGVVPGISPILANPVDLGIKADPVLVTEFDATHGMINELPDGVVPEGREPIYTGEASLDVELTSEQITSILDYWRKQYPKTPIRDVQVRINQDGTAEASGILELTTAVTMAKQLGYSDSDIEKGKSYAKYVAGDLPFYISGSANVVNNNVTINPSQVQIGRVNLPESISKPVAGVVAETIERRMRQVPGVEVKEMSHDKGLLHLVATGPNTIK